jgi:endonuclease NucS-like protein
MPDEDMIRDRLSETLDILEPGLTLIEVNHKLPNDVGAKGFIDILARDKLGNLVIIELKRSDQAARQALFEILKYMPLFRRQHGTPAHRIRCFIVSTTWHELLVPYSEFRRLCETQTEGFKIEVDVAGNVLKSEKVTDHAEDALPQPFRVHVAYLYPTAEERAKALPTLRNAYTIAGAEGYLLLQLDYKGADRRVIYRFGAYYVPTRIKADLLGKLTKEATAELEEAEDGPPDAASIRDGVENSFLAIVQESLGEHILTTNLESLIRNPESFTAMVEGGWSVISIERVGPFVSASVMPDAEVIHLVKGVAGESTVRFSRLGSPKHKLDWAQVRVGAQNSLRGNPTWEAGFYWFLDHIEKEFSDGTAYLQVYNPLMLPESLYRFAVQNDPEYIPQLALMVVSSDGNRREGLVGTIIWDGKTVPRSITSVFSEGFCDGIHDYYMHKTIGTAWELDQELMQRHGLEYGLWSLRFIPGEIEEHKRLILNTDGKVEEAADKNKPASLTDYVNADGTEPYLMELFAEINRSVSR